jgi:D-cysteine desulfhydrase
MKKLSLAHLPTPLWHHEALDRLVGTEVWVKRDDMTSGAAAGNKIRKLEYLLADALERRATTVVTCGGIQSNHARATALLAAEVGLRAVLVLRVADPTKQAPSLGNLLLDRLAGARIRFVTPAQYQERHTLLPALQRELEAQGERVIVIPEGGSNALGSLGYVEAMAEVRQQLDLGLGPGRNAPIDSVVHACGSGGTTAGVALGVKKWGVAGRAVGIAVCDTRAYFEPLITRIMQEARSLDPTLEADAPFTVYDDFKGPAYGFASPEQQQFLYDVCRRTGLVLDPVYTGKALFGLSRLEPKPHRALFLHTGGLPGLLAQASSLEHLLTSG